MTRNRASAKKAGTCDVCEAALPPRSSRGGRPPLTCGAACLAARRRLHYAANPRPRALRASLRDRLVAKLAPTANGCLEFTASKNNKGYGQIGVGKRLQLAHRVAYELAHGPIADGLIVRHSCDNPPCCNPAHLLLGTPLDNSRDAVERDRVARAFRLPQTRLTDQEVAAVRMAVLDGATHASTAAAFGICRQYVGQLVNHKYRSSRDQSA